MSAQSSYEMFQPANVDLNLLTEVLAKHRLTPQMTAAMLPFGKTPSGVYKVGAETRRLYFNNAVGDNGKLVPFKRLARNGEDKCLPVTRILSWGKCNVACPYCKRDMQDEFLGDEGEPIFAQKVTLLEIAAMAEGAVLRGETPRYSGGDPVSFPGQTLALAEYIFLRHGVKSSIAHNGTGPAMVQKLWPYLSSAAIDLKAAPEKLAEIMKIEPLKGPKFYDLSLRTQATLSHNGVLLDVRTPVFGDASVNDMLRLAADIVAHNDLSKTFWTWRMYKPVQWCDWTAPASADAVKEMMKVVSSEFPYLWMGIRAKWHRGGMEYIKGGEVIAGTGDDSYLPAEAEFSSGNLLVAAA